MPFNGAGTFTVYTPGNPIANGDVSNANYFNNTMTDFATGLSNMMTRDGQGTPTANIPMGNNKLTGLANGTVSTDAAAYGQVTAASSTAQSGSQQWLTSVAGTNTITASLSGVTSYTSGLTVRFTASGANTGATTLNINSIGVINLIRADGVALATGDLLSGGTYETIYDGTSFKLQGSISASQIPATTKQIQSVTATVASNALTLGLNATSLDFRNSSLTNGAPNTRTVSTISLVVPSGASLGTINATQARLALLAIDNSGTVELAVINLSGGNQLDETNLISTTAISAGATANNVFYSTAGRTNVPYRVVGFVDITETTAGTWASAPTEIQGVGGQALAALSSIGYGQTWQTFTSVTRVIGTTYYNTTGKPITVIAQTSGTAASATVNGVNIVTGGAISSPVTFIVPAGGSYSYNAGTFTSWAELR